MDQPGVTQGRLISYPITGERTNLELYHVPILTCPPMSLGVLHGACSIKNMPPLLLPPLMLLPHPKSIRLLYQKQHRKETKQEGPQ